MTGPGSNPQVLIDALTGHLKSWYRYPTYRELAFCCRAA
jgi:hypothetical protein